MARPNRTPKTPRDGQSDGPKRPRLSLGTFYLFVLVTLLLLALASMLNNGAAQRDVDYSDFLAQLQRGDIEEFTIRDNVDVQGVYTAQAIDAGRVQAAEPQPTFGRQPDARAARTFRETASAGSGPRHL